jgi:hypothetical protein
MLHFAPRYGIVSPCLTWGLRPRRAVTVRRPANDNGAALPGTREGANDHGVHEDALLAAALRLFAAHGLSAARRACEAAEIAAASGDMVGAKWWIAVCASLDSAMARDCAARAMPQR